MRELVTFTAVAVFVGAANLAAAGVSAAADLGGVHDRDMRDMRKSMPMPVHLTNWTGFYIGAGVGGAMFSASDTEIIPGIGRHPCRPRRVPSALNPPRCHHA